MALHEPTKARRIIRCLAGLLRPPFGTHEHPTFGLPQIPVIKHSVGIAISVALLTILLWALLNRPQEELPWPTTIQGFSFSPHRAEDNPIEKKFPTVESIDADLKLLAGSAHAVRTYTVENTFAEIPRLARKHKLSVALGAWVDGRLELNEQEITKALKIAKDNYSSVVRVFIGNEVLLHDLVPIETLIGYLDRARAELDVPVSVAEPWHIWLKYPELVKHVDFIGVHLLPYWEGVPAEEAVGYAVQRYKEVEAAYPGKPIIIGEVGWPSNGRTIGGATASLATEAMFLRRFLNIAEENDWTYYVMEAFDQPWKEEVEGAVGAYWGVYNAAREAKFPFNQPIVNIPEWRELAAISVLAAIGVLLLVLRDSHTLDSKGRGFLALVTYATTTLAVYLVYNYTQQYMSVTALLVGIFMLLAIISLILVLLAEAHEWAESLWSKGLRRPFPDIKVDDDQLPFVSIHVPAYNEPPDMLIETLNALDKLGYPRFEVLVIDNNTKDPAVWEPVEAHCAKLGEKFRFFHVAPLAGFKAGALNFALKHTDPRAEVVAVIDSDYIVDPCWLRDLVPAFADKKTAIVQAPQDYRDGDQNAFKAMCFAEYRGFFHIGMITRNERNAIIQHGTMTMVRRKVLDELEGWGEWCITEDAELGLRVFEEGLEATYIPRSYGRGLMPDTFLDFKKQRWRWVYGAVLIMRQHLHELLGTEDTKLTIGQRYHFIAGWLPWMADGVNLLFNLAALTWSVAIVLFPHHVDPPLVIFAIFPLVLFLFKMLKMVFLYKKRVRATARQSLAAALAGLALSHTISHAIITGFITKGVGFFRTPKMENPPALIRAFMDAREELLMMTALLLAAVAVQIAQPWGMLDMKIWSVMLVVQSIPYFAAGLVSLTSALPNLPASLVGTMGELDEPGMIPPRKPGCAGKPQAQSGSDQSTSNTA